jgi:hypothetical protein
MKFSLYGGTHKAVGGIMAAICVGAIVWGVLQSKKETPGLMDDESGS